MSEMGDLKFTTAGDYMMDTNSTYNVTADELRQFIERYEQLEAEKKDITATQKEVMAELSGRGYDKKAFKKIVMLRKKSSDQIAEENAIIEMYAAALGMDI
jgi:uncharacterized protein (UPF0335 family)